jgi:hypothetical protein
MHQLDELREALDREFPDHPGRAGDWNGVLARAQAPTRRRRTPLIALAAAIAAVVVSILLWPGGEGSPRVLERALAVATEGPVVHLVLGPEDARITEIDLDSGAQRRLQGRHEQWFDPERGFHDLYTIDGQVIEDVLYPAGSNPEVEQQFLALTEYRRALRSGKASVTGGGKVDGRDVHWLRFHVRYPSFGIPSHDADHEVAVDAETFEPRLWRAIPTKDSLSFRETTEVEIEFWETFPGGSGDFTAARSSLDLGPGQPPPLESVRRRRTIEAARRILSPPPVWLGEEFRGLHLFELFQPGVKRVGPRARVRMRRELDFCYARVPEACPSRYPRLPDEPYVSLNVTNRVDFAPRPREGKLIFRDQVVHGPRPFPNIEPGYARRHGVFVAITATDRKLIVAAARALKPMR